MSFEALPPIKHPGIDEEVIRSSYVVPEAFAKDNEDVFEPEHMHDTSAEERKEILQGVFRYKVMDWMESQESDPKLEASIRGSAYHKQMARMVSEAYLEFGWISKEQQIAKLDSIGISDTSR